MTIPKETKSQMLARLSRDMFDLIKEGHPTDWIIETNRKKMLQWKYDQIEGDLTYLIGEGLPSQVVTQIQINKIMKWKNKQKISSEWN